jgi:hypothetical protein
MGVSVWTFLQSKPGEIFPVAQHAMDDFPDNTGRLGRRRESVYRWQSRAPTSVDGLANGFPPLALNL